MILIFHEPPAASVPYFDGYQSVIVSGKFSQDLRFLMSWRIAWNALLKFGAIRFGLVFWISASLLRAYKPRLVITFIDNSVLFQKLDRIYHKEFKFFAIQNGVRGHLLPREGIRRVFHSNLWTMTRGEQSLYQRHGATVLNCVAIGSFRLADFIEKNKWCYTTTPEYDICLVSNYKNNSHYIEQYRTFILKLVELASQRHWSCVVALRCDSTDQVSDENQFFSKVSRESPETIRLVYSIRGTGWTTYSVAFKSRVLVGLNTSVLKEMLPYRKVLSVNPTQNATYDFPVDVPLSLNRHDYALHLSERLSNLLNLSDAGYFDLIQSKYIELTPEFSPTEGVAYLRKLIEGVPWH